MRETILFAALFGIVSLLVFPLPGLVLDISIAANLALSFLLLVRAVQIPRAELFTTLPTLLLLTALFRLGLNVSTTRQLLVYGEAPEIVAAFGEFVAGGSIAAGFTIFLILTVVQFVVVAKGAERVAEVAARFALDALPGKQMAIDAELRSGNLSASEARVRRQALGKESRLYGALDGAMKFVKGDTIAGIVITVINLLVGFGVGVFVHELAPAVAARRFTLFTIGDGLVAQVPSLLVSTASAVVISRVSDESERALASDLLQQLARDRNALMTVAAVVALFAFCPGFPVAPFLAIAAVLALFANNIKREEGREAVPAPLPESGEPLVLLLDQGKCELAELRTRTEIVRHSVYRKCGVLLPSLSLIPTRESEAFGIVLNGRTIPIVNDQPDAPMNVQTLEAELTRHAHLFVDDLHTQKICEFQNRDASELIQRCIPGIISHTQLTRLTRMLLEEKVSVRRFSTILQSIAESAFSSEGRLVRREEFLLAEVRIGLRDSIVPAIANTEAIDGYIIEPSLERVLVKAFFADAPVLPEISSAIVAAVQQLKAQVVISTKYSRRLLFQILSKYGMEVTVICPEEFPPQVTFRCAGTIRLSASQAQLVS